MIDTCNLTIAVTGHRPNRLNNEYDLNGPISSYIRKEINSVLDQEKPDKIVTGMALGVDTLFALVGIERNIRIIAAIPCANQDSKWTQKSKDLYHKILDNSLIETHFCYTYYDGRYTPDCMLKRDEYMVNICDKLLAVWNGDKSGGTYHTVKYAQKQNKPIIRINPNDYNL